jgi:hypothetical protein
MFVGELAVPHAKHLCYSMSMASMMVKREIPATCVHYHSCNCFKVDVTKSRHSLCRLSTLKSNTSYEQCCYGLAFGRPYSYRRSDVRSL